MPPVFEDPVPRGAARRPHHHQRSPQTGFHSTKKKQNSKGLIWLMFHALQVRQGPMEN
jgi:uncharacterized UPF0160 family protein